LTNIIDLHYYNVREGTSLYSVFRQLVANGRIKFSFAGVSVELREEDLYRLHDIVNEIDVRRAFYDSHEDENCDYAVASILEAKSEINKLRRGVWANAWAENMIGEMLHCLGEFLTETHNAPLPKNHHDERFDLFANAMVILRLEVWTIVAHLVVVFGPRIHVQHLPPDILTDVKSAYKNLAIKG